MQLIKAMNMEGKVAVKKQVTNPKTGKTVMITFYVKPEKAEKWAKEGAKIIGSTGEKMKQKEQKIEKPKQASDNKQLESVLKELETVYRKYREVKHPDDMNRDVAVKYGVTDIFNQYKDLPMEDMIGSIKAEIEDYQKNIDKEEQDKMSDEEKEQYKKDMKKIDEVFGKE